MPRRGNLEHTPKQKRQAKHIQESYAKRGMSAKRRKEIAWATVNKMADEGHGGASERSGRAGRVRHPRRGVSRASAPS